MTVVRGEYVVCGRRRAWHVVPKRKYMEHGYYTATSISSLFGEMEDKASAMWKIRVLEAEKAILAEYGEVKYYATRASIGESVYTIVRDRPTRYPNVYVDIQDWHRPWRTFTYVKSDLLPVAPPENQERPLEDWEKELMEKYTELMEKYTAQTEGYTNHL